MVDLLLKLIDKLIQLATLSEQKKKEAIKDTLDPLFADLEAVHTDDLMNEDCVEIDAVLDARQSTDRPDQWTFFTVA